MREPEQVGETRAGDHPIEIHAAEALAEIRHEREFARRARGEVGVAAFGRRRHEPPVDVMEERFAKAGAGRNEGGIPGGHRDAFLQRGQLVGFEHRHGVCHRLEVVQERDGTV